MQANSLHTIFAVFFVFLDACHGLFECRTTRKGVEYSGTRSYTLSGLECQRWDSQHPHAHSHTLPYFFAENDVSKAENYCRNPSSEETGPWCFTTDASVEWETCAIPVCVPFKEPCKSTGLGKEYVGTVNYTNTGRVCQRWDQQSPHTHSRNAISSFPDDVASLSDIENFCRNPDSESGGPWCYTMDVTRWEYCDVPLCSNEQKISSIVSMAHPISTSVLQDGDTATCLLLSSPSANDFRLKITPTLPWTDAAVEFAFKNGSFLNDCSQPEFFAYYHMDGDCGKAGLCRWAEVMSSTADKYCMFICSCKKSSCHSLSLTVSSQLEKFELCEVVLHTS